MAAQQPYESDGLDPEGPSGDDLERFGSELKTCPDCGDEVYDQAEFCTRCNYSFLPSDEVKGIPLWAMAAAGLVLVAILLFGTVL